MEAKESKITGIHLDGAEYLIMTLEMIVEEAMGLENIDFEENEEARKLYKKICSEAGDIITENFRKSCGAINPKDDAIFNHSIIVEDENFDKWFCAPLINLDALCDKYCPKK